VAIVTIICGTTGSGKTELALKMAAGKPTSIISADSRQAYHDLGIITGTDIPKGFKKKLSDLTFRGRPVPYFSKSLNLPKSPKKPNSDIRLWGFDLLRLGESGNAAEFADLTREIINKEAGRGRQIIVVGGTGFYLNALTRPQTLAGVAPNQKLRRQLSNLSVQDLRHRLNEIDPDKLSSMNQSDSQNPRRLIRAIEVASSRPLELDQFVQLDQNLKFFWLGLRQPIEELRPKIRARVINRLNRGAAKEVVALLQNYPNQSLPIYTTLGVRPIMDFLAGHIDRERLIDRWTTEEVNYAKRQITWFAKQPQIIWYT